MDPDPTEMSADLIHCNVFAACMQLALFGRNLLSANKNSGTMFFYITDPVHCKLVCQKIVVKSWIFMIII